MGEGGKAISSDGRRSSSGGVCEDAIMDGKGRKGKGRRKKGEDEGETRKGTDCGVMIVECSFFLANGSDGGMR